jgi:hypothetical protein
MKYALLVGTVNLYFNILRHKGYYFKLPLRILHVYTSEYSVRFLDLSVQSSVIVVLVSLKSLGVPSAGKYVLGGRNAKGSKYHCTRFLANQCFTLRLQTLQFPN